MGGMTQLLSVPEFETRDEKRLEIVRDAVHTKQEAVRRAPNLGTYGLPRKSLSSNSSSEFIGEIPVHTFWRNHDDESIE
jgi:hypothetical protein